MAKIEHLANDKKIAFSKQPLVLESEQLIFFENTLQREKNRYLRVPTYLIPKHYSNQSKLVSTNNCLQYPAQCCGVRSCPNVLIIHQTHPNRSLKLLAFKTSIQKPYPRVRIRTSA